MHTIAVASTNPVKIDAALLAFQAAFPEEEFTAAGYDVASGVSDQPMTNQETLAGAKNRLAAVKAAAPTADYWVGIEGGAEDDGQEITIFAWTAVMKNNQISTSRTASYLLPPAVRDLLRQGMELGHANDLVFNVTNSKQKTGSVGSLSHSIIDRKEYYRHALVLALIPFLNPGLYPAK